MSTGSILILAFVAGFVYWARRFLGSPYLERPIILGPITGLVLGDLQTGLVVGGTLELIFIGAAPIGGSVPPNVVIGSILGTAFAIIAGQGVEQALVIAIPAALLGSLFELFAKAFGSVFVNMAERFADRANLTGISASVHLGNIAHGLSTAIPTYLALSLGSEFVQGFLNNFPNWAQQGFKVAGGALPALGFGLLLATLATPRLIPFFFVGFLITVYTSFGVIGVALLGALVAILIVVYRYSTQEQPQTEAAPQEEKRPSTELVTRKEQVQMFWRSFGIQSAFSFDRMQALGFTWGLMPLLSRLYQNKEDLTAALRRHLVFFNTNPWVVGPVMAMTASMEARRAAGEEVDVESIQGLKAGLMGPLAGIGDSLFIGMLRSILSGVSASLALAGNPFAPLLFFFGNNIVHVWVRWESLMYTFRRGASFIADLESNRMRNIMEGATITGLMALGSLVGSWLAISTPLAYTIQQKTIAVQDILDQILPKMLPLAATLVIYYLFRKNLNTMWLLIITAIFFFIMGALGIFG